MALLNSLASWFIRQRLSQIERSTVQPIETQKLVLTKLLADCQNTAYGQAYDFKSIADASVFRERLPIHTYETIKPYIDRMLKGEQNVLWHSDIIWFAKSSGTTAGKSKLIPVSKEALDECHYKAGTDLFALYLNMREDALIFDGVSLGMGGTLHPIEGNSKMQCGDVSAILMHNLPFWAEIMRTPSIEIALMENWEAKIDRIAEATIERNVTSIVGVPSWTLILLKHILKKSGKQNIHEVWPNLELFVHGGVGFTPYREQFQQLIPSERMQYLETYNATEGFFAIQDQADSSDMLLLLDYGIYYEFIPIHELGQENPQCIGLESVELKKNYAMVITTNSGLWRYMIGDTVVFTSLDPYRIRISGRTKCYINTFGEELIEDNAIKALSRCCQRFDAKVTEFTAAPVYMDNHEQARHQWLIEFEKAPESIPDFAKALDHELQRVNSDYEAKRSHNILLQNLELLSVPQQSFYQWMKSNGKLGGQHKVPHLSNDRRVIESILHFIQSR